MTFEQLIRSKQFKYTIYGLIGLVVIIVVFAAGMLAGFNRAKFSYTLGQRDYGNFYGSPRSPLNQDTSLANPFSSVGKIVKISGSVLTVESQENVEKNIIVGSGTLIKKGNSNIQLSGLATDDQIAVIGSPDSQGQIDAKFIRVLINN